MGLGSRLRNLFSPSKGGKNNRSNSHNDSSTTAIEGGEQILFSPNSTTTATATATTADNGGATTTKKSKRTTTTSSPPSSTHYSKATTNSSSTQKKKRHCDTPGCTRAIFARGKCYRHDNELKTGKTSSDRDEDANTTTVSNGGGGGRNKSTGSSGGKRKSAKANHGSANGEKVTNKKKREGDTKDDDRKPAASAASAKTKKKTAKQRTTSSSPKLEHCSHPGCTRALFARGKCYRHDHETSSSSEKKSSSTPRDSPAADEKEKKQSSGKMDGGKKSVSLKSKLKSSLITTPPTTPAKKPTTPKSSSGLKHCSYPGCTRALFARGHCYRHDREAKHSAGEGSPTPMKTPSNSSSATSSSSGGKKKKKRKSDNTTATSTPTSALITKKAKVAKSSSGSKHCSHPGCGRAIFARGMCYRHDTEAKRSGGSGGDGVSPSRSTTTTPTPKSTKRKKVVAYSPEEKELSSSTKKKKGHCNYPGCTRALFARGKCYRHDHETRSDTKPSSRSSSSRRSKRASSSSSSSSLAVAKKSNAKSAVPILSSLTKALTSSSQHCQRKSAIARRPRQLKATEKLLAMQEDALALNAVVTTTTSANGGKKKRKKTSSTTTGEKWECTRCTTINPHSRNRCTACQGWRGGKREGYSPPNKKARVSRGSGGGGGGGTMEELTANTMEEEEESNYDDVVCCLCKCGVDFSDADFFLPEDYDEKLLGGVNNGVASSSSLEGEDRLCKLGEEVKGNLKSEGLDDEDDYGALIYQESQLRKREAAEAAAASAGKAKSNANSANGDDAVDSEDDDAKDDKSRGEDASSADDEEEEKPPFQLPRRFYNPRNGLILCDGPAHAWKRRGSSSNGQQRYQCERAYHQRCHFIPVFAVPRGPWRCLICRYRDEEYLRKRGKGNVMDDSEARVFTDQELNDMFRCNIPQPRDETELKKEGEEAIIINVPPAMMSPSKSAIASLENEFEHVTGPLKAKIMNEDLTSKAEKVINAALSNIRNSEHSLRSFTETSRSRKALADRIQCIGGLPQELTQCVMRIAQNKLRIKDLIVVLEESIRCAPHHVNTKSEDSTSCIDAVSELMQWYLSQSSPEEAAHFDPDEAQDGKTLLQHLFPEGDLRRRRFEPRTGEARVEAENTSVNSDSSGVSLDDLKCSCCHGGAATDDNDMLLCDGIGCYRAFHMECLEPKVTLEEIEAGEDDEAWFCPLCTAHANLVHYAQREYLLDDWEHDWDEIMRRRGHTEWETADDVFPEADLELRVAQKFKDGIKDDETTTFIAETFGIGGAAVDVERDELDEDNLAAHDDNDDEDDDDFDSRDEDGSDGNSSAAEDMHEEKKLLKEKIGKDELDALSVCSSSEQSDSDDSSGEDEGLRRSKRRRFTFPVRKGSESSDDESSDSKPKDMGALDTSNILMGKRNRSKVDYRKLADTMFGDDSDEEAKGSVMKYDYKPKKAPVDESSDEDESSDDSDDDDNEESG